MKKQNRILMAVAALLLVAVYFLPIWSIALEAPQYPGGIGLNISINKIEGKEHGDLQNVNGLNHYIGMRPIVPDSIPELRYMPIIIGFMIATGLLIAFFGNRKWLLIWLILFTLLAIIGLADFYLWEYDYGHNLNPDAPIKVPGMSYSPPFIGSKKIMNFYATSLPHTGFFFILASVALGGWVWWSEGRNEGKNQKEKKENAPSKVNV